MTRRRQALAAGTYYHVPRYAPSQGAVQRAKARVVSANAAYHRNVELIRSGGVRLTRRREEQESAAALEKVHRYNDMKDVGQMLLGRVGQLEGKTTKELYEAYGMDPDD